MKKEKFAALALIIMTVFLIGAIFYFSYLLMESPSGNSTSSAVAPKKTKAQVVNSERFVALNQINNPSPTSSTISSSPTISDSTSPTVSLSETSSATETEAILPSPTEIILAKANPSLKPQSTSKTPSPTNLKKLPDSGYLKYNLIIFGAAIFLIFYSFIF